MICSGELDEDRSLPTLVLGSQTSQVTWPMGAGMNTKGGNPSGFQKKKISESS